MTELAAEELGSRRPATTLPTDITVAEAFTQASLVFECQLLLAERHHAAREEAPSNGEVASADWLNLTWIS